VDIKVAGSLSLAVSLPPLLAAFARYSQDHSFAVLHRNRTFVIVMAARSIAGTVIGGRLLGVVPTTTAHPRTGRSPAALIPPGSGGTPSRRVSSDERQ
jgi:hypothetical protein